MKRTPPRRSPRINQEELIVSDTYMAGQTSNDGVSATSANTSAEATAVGLQPSSVESLSTTGQSNTVMVTAAASQQQITLEAMQCRMVALENELRNAQVKLSERDLQCHALKEALQNRSVQNTTYSQPIVQLIPPLSSAITLCSTIPTHSTVTTQPTVSFINPLLSSSTQGYSSQSSLSTRLSQHYHTPQITTTSAESYSGTSQHTSTVPRKLLDLPEFNGDPEDWPMFSTAFTESTSVYNYSNFENNIRLQKSLKGEARNVVRCMMIHANNVNAVMEQLRSSFGRPEQLIDSQLRQVQQIPPISESSIEMLIPFAVKAKNLAVFLSSINGQHHLSNPTLLKELVSKLPMSQRIVWAGYAAQIHPYPTIVDFSDWLSRIADLISTVKDTESRSTVGPKRRSVLHAAEGQPADKLKCPICQLHHSVVECKRFLGYNVNERWVQAKRLRLCFTCLEAGHAIRNCRRRRRACGIVGCQKGHHQLLHERRHPVVETAPTPHAQKEPEVNKTKEAVLSCTASPVKNCNLLFRVLPVTVYGPKKQVDTYALLDEGSSITMMDNSLIEELGLNGHRRRLDLQWLGGRAAQETATVVNIFISGTQMKKKYELRNVYGVCDLRLPTQSLNMLDLNNDHRCLKRFQTLPYDSVTPKLLIGLDHCHLGLPSETVRLRDGGPFAAHTKIGWVVFGPTNRVAPEKYSCLLVKTGKEDLHELIADYFSIESFGVRPAPAIETETDVRARSILESTTVKVNGRFQTGLLWKCDNIEFPDSYTMAKKRLVGIERKMRRDKGFAAAYNEIITGYVTKGYARILQPAEAATFYPRTWYLPHFAVVNPNKPGKLRLVFDAAATVDGVSLNSCLLKGPQQYQPMPSVLFNFRVGAIAVCGDIREMFHQVLIRPEDRCSQRFLWRKGNEDVQPDIYEMLVMTFGAACSPCAAQYVKNVNALEHLSVNARAVKSILQHHYIDDFVDSFETTEEAICVAKKVSEIHKGAGFELRNFSSNSPEVTRALEGRAESTMAALENNMSLDENLITEKVLGMFWQPSTDSFRYQLRFHRVDPDIISGIRCPSKRELLRVIMSVFDPLGFLANFLIGAKLLMREVWRCDLRWDEPIPSNINAAWIKWCQNLELVATLRIPRYYFVEGLPKRVQLHVLVDASEEAFAAVAYWRAEGSKGKVAVSFVCAKTKCAPMKPMTIPRLELQAAVLGTRLMQTIVEEHSLDINRCVQWTDSKTVIGWIRSKHRRYKPFVAHRIAEILATTQVASWKWLPTEDNVADEATRSKFGINSSKWLTGPDFLRNDERMWPTDHLHDSHHEDNEDEELRPKFNLLAVSFNFIKFNDFSSYLKLKRTIAWVVRFIGRSRRLTKHANGLTVNELHSAEVVLCRQAQAEVYSVEIARIRDGQCLRKESALYKLLPYIDEEGVLRVRGRIDAASWLPLNSKRPIILPPNHVFTELVVAHYHCKMKHVNVEATVCEIRRQYWIPRLRQVLRKMITRCCVCKLARAKPSIPVMGPLPEDRLTPFVRPFSYTGLDYFGPLTVTIGRRTEKRWVALFTCLTVRAIHLEVVCDLSTDACILALRNFINRRGVPIRIRSDNGKNFVGVDQEAKRFNEVFDCGRVTNELSSKGVEWVFNCPSNPAEGGVWERMVQCVKRVLRHTPKEISPREYTLQSLIIEAENVVNSRPLTHLPISVDQEEPLTPNHFLLGTANTAQTPSVNDQFKKLCSLRKQWRIARQLRDSFWKRWVSEYLPTLTCRSKWCKQTEPLKEGDVVFICDVNIPRKEWCRGRIEQVYKGPDGIVRRADVRTNSGCCAVPFPSWPFLVWT